MPAYTWANAASGNWSTATNWTPNGIPGAAGGDTATIGATGAAYTITYDEAAEALNAFTINSSTATLNFDAGDALTVFGQTLLQAGTIDLLTNGSTFNAGGLTTSSGTTINISTGGTLTYSSGSIAGLVDLSGNSAFGGAGNALTLSGMIEATSGTGTVNFAAITGTGTLEANGGRLVVESSLANATVAAVISNSAASVFETTGALFFGSGVNIQFLGAAGEFQYNNSANDSNVHFNISGLNAGSSTTTPTNFVGLANETVTVTSGGTGSGTTGNIVLSNGDTLAVTGITGNLSLGWAAETASDGSGGTEIFLAAVCYAAGTRILTPAGERVIESLRQGDLVMTLSRCDLVAQPVKWLGRRRIDLGNIVRPETVAPIRIHRHAFADGVPHRDLIVSPDHAIFVDGNLICARQLVNGITIRQEFGLASVDYYHVELDQHAILLAEGLTAESYLDTGNSQFFANADAPVMLHPDLPNESSHPVREAASCAPFVWDEPSVQPVWQHLADRAATISSPMLRRTTTEDADLRLCADGQILKPISKDTERVTFVLPRNVTEVRLVSRAQSPTEARPWLEDRRRLGVRVSHIMLRGTNDVREIPVDHPDLTEGWWAVELDGLVMRRWTDGDAMLPLPPIDGPVMLEVHLAGAMTYVTEAALAA